jgi:hypothetical protein
VTSERISIEIGSRVARDGEVCEVVALEGDQVVERHASGETSTSV